MLLLDNDLRVVAASQGYLNAFGNAESPEGRRVHEITGGAWSEAPTQALIEHVRRGDPIAGAVDAVVMCPEGERRVRIGVMLIDAEADHHSPLMVTIEDRTEAAAREMAREERLRQAEALLDEAQHRTANNLAMISAILGLKAKRVTSEETRRELEGARRRLVAMATIERNLQLEQPDRLTAMRPYLEELCRRLSESLVDDARRIEIVVEAHPGAQPRRTAVILGLVVTESVINALKHAFPEHRDGRILVEYWETAGSYGAAVTDDGMGASGGAEPEGGGLGASIVATLALQLKAKVKVTNSQPGMRVELSWGSEGR